MLDEQFLYAHYIWGNIFDFNNGPSWGNVVVVENHQVAILNSYPFPHFHCRCDYFLHFCHPSTCSFLLVSSVNFVINISYTTSWFSSFFLSLFPWIPLVATLLWESVRMKLTLLKWGLGSPPRLLKLQSSITGVKTPRIGMFFIWLESYQSVDVQNGLTWAIWTFVADVMAKRKAESQIGSLTPDH